MSGKFQTINRDTPYLLPPSIQDWLPEQHLARFVVDIVDQLDLSKLEQTSYDSVAFRFITADSHPDHDTIASFRKRFLPEQEGLFVQLLVVARVMGLFKLGKVSLDGTKVKANASKHKAMSWHGERTGWRQLPRLKKRLSGGRGSVLRQRKVNGIWCVWPGI